MSSSRYLQVGNTFLTKKTGPIKMDPARKILFLMYYLLSTTLAVRVPSGVLILIV